MKKAFALILCLLMLLSCVPVHAEEAGETGAPAQVTGETEGTETPESPEGGDPETPEGGVQDPPEGGVQDPPEGGETPPEIPQEPAEGTPPPPLPKPEIVLPAAAYAGVDASVSWTASLSGALYTVTVTDPAGKGNIVFSTNETAVVIPGAFLSAAGNYPIEVRASLGGFTDSVSSASLHVTAPASSVLSVIHNKAEVIGKYRYCTAGYTRTFRVITSSPDDVILVYIDGRQVSVVNGGVEAYTGGTWAHVIDLVFSRGIHKIGFCTETNPVQAQGRVASPSAVAERAMYGTAATLIYSWPEEGYHSSRYMTPGTPVTLKGELNGFDYILWGDKYYFVRTGTLAWDWESSFSVTAVPTAVPAQPATPAPYVSSGSGNVLSGSGHKHNYVNGQCTECGAKVIGLGYGGFMAFAPETVTLPKGGETNVTISRRLTASDVNRLSIEYDRNVVSLDISGDTVKVRGLADGFTEIVFTLNGTEVGRFTAVSGAGAPPSSAQAPGGASASAQTADTDGRVYSEKGDGRFGANPLLIGAFPGDYADLRRILTENGADAAAVADDSGLLNALSFAADDSGLCAVIANLIMTAYEGKEDRFLNDFGYEMTDAQGNCRLNVLLADIIFTLGEDRENGLTACLEAFSAARGGIFEAEEFKIVFLPLDENYYAQYAGAGVQMAAVIRAGEENEFIPWYDPAENGWSVRVVDAGTEFFASVAGALSQNAVLIPEGAAAEYFGGAAPKNEEILSVEGQKGVFSEEFLRGGSFETIGIRITLK